MCLSDVQDKMTLAGAVVLTFPFLTIQPSALIFDSKPTGQTDTFFVNLICLKERQVCYLIKSFTQVAMLCYIEFINRSI